VPIGCAGVAVYPGEVLMGDRDGVLVIPRALAAEVAEQGYEQEQLEAYVSTKIHAREPQLLGSRPRPGASVPLNLGRVVRVADSCGVTPRSDGKVVWAVLRAKGGAQ
jgi:hypothetical protein